MTIITCKSDGIKLTTSILKCCRSDSFARGYNHWRTYSMVAVDRTKAKFSFSLLHVPIIKVRWKQVQFLACAIPSIESSSQGCPRHCPRPVIQHAYQLALRAIDRLCIIAEKNHIEIDFLFCLYKTASNAKTK